MKGSAASAASALSDSGVLSASSRTSAASSEPVTDTIRDSISAAIDARTPRTATTTKSSPGVSSSSASSSSASRQRARNASDGAAKCRLLPIRRSVSSRRRRYFPREAQIRRRKRRRRSRLSRRSRRSRRSRARSRWIRRPRRTTTPRRRTTLAKRTTPPRTPRRAFLVRALPPRAARPPPRPGLSRAASAPRTRARERGDARERPRVDVHERVGIQPEKRLPEKRLRTFAAFRSSRAARIEHDAPRRIREAPAQFFAPIGGARVAGDGENDRARARASLARASAISGADSARIPIGSVVVFERLVFRRRFQIPRLRVPRLRVPEWVRRPFVAVVGTLDTCDLKGVEVSERDLVDAQKRVGEIASLVFMFSSENGGGGSSGGVLARRGCAVRKSEVGTEAHPDVRRADGHPAHRRARVASRTAATASPRQRSAALLGGVRAFGRSNEGPVFVGLVSAYRLSFRA